MKKIRTQKLLLFILIGLAFTACDVYVTEPRHEVSIVPVFGHYEVDEYSNTYNSYHSYHLEIDNGYERNEIIIYNFYDIGVDVFAYIHYDQITIPFQVISGYEIEGSGTINGRQIFFDYTVRDRYIGVTDFCDADAWRN